MCVRKSELLRSGGRCSSLFYFWQKNKRKRKSTGKWTVVGRFQIAQLRTRTFWMFFGVPRWKERCRVSKIETWPLLRPPSVAPFSPSRCNKKATRDSYAFAVSNNERLAHFSLSIFWVWVGKSVGTGEFVAGVYVSCGEGSKRQKQFGRTHNKPLRSVVFLLLMQRKTSKLCETVTRRARNTPIRRLSLLSQYYTYTPARESYTSYPSPN